MEDLERAVEDFKEIRDTGKFNMFMQKSEVLRYANDNDYYDLVAYCGNDTMKYLEVMEAV